MRNKYLFLFALFAISYYPIIGYGYGLSNQQNVEINRYTNWSNYAANDTTTIKKDNPFLIKFDVARLLPDMFGIKYGCICFGVEKHFKIKNSVTIDLGYITDYGETKDNQIPNISAKNVTGYYSNIEYRNYYKIKTNYKFYLGINFSYQKTKTEREELFNSNRYFVSRYVYASHIKAGIKMQFSHFVFDPEIGWGIRYINSNTTNKKGTPEGEYEFPYNKLYNTGDKLFLSLNYNLKIGWVF